MRQFFDSRADRWDSRVQSDAAEYLAPLVAALDHMQATPARILDIGTGTGAAAIELIDRYPTGEVTGIDVSEGMIAQVEAKVARLSGRVRFLVATS